jgi:hypothetical protein
VLANPFAKKIIKSIQKRNEIIKNEWKASNKKEIKKLKKIVTRSHNRRLYWRSSCRLYWRLYWRFQYQNCHLDHSKGGPAKMMVSMFLL